MFGGLQKSIGTKLTLWLSLALVVALATITIMNIVYQNSAMTGREHEAVLRVGEVVLTAMRYPMMTGEQEIVQLQFDEYKDIEGVEVLNLLDHDGIIRRSTDASIIGSKSKAVGLDRALSGEEIVGIERYEETQSRVFSELRPVFNEEKCQLCHGSKAKVLGVLRLAMDWTPVDAALNATRNRNIMLSIGGIILMAVLLFFLIRTMLTKPMASLITSVEPLGSGDLTQKIEIPTHDEIGRLAASFNQIADSMSEIIMAIRTTSDKVASSSQELSSSTQEVNASTQQVSTAIQQINKGATTQSERVEETFEAMEKTSNTLKQVVADAKSTTKGVSEASERAESGRVDAQDTVEKISQLTSTVSTTAKVIQGLGEKSQQIGEITDTITSIADQTNLLALNAAIEAARAGEAGRGFAVVAEEIRKLAEGSAEAVRRIGGLVKAIQNETNRAVGSIEKSAKEVEAGRGAVSKIAETLGGINKSVQDANRLAKQISDSTDEQVKSTETVVGSVNQVASIAKESVSTAEEVSSSVEEQTASMQEMSASAQELARLAMELKDLVSKFKLRESA
jgi:methyl-accepting chemotaxis protein